MKDERSKLEKVLRSDKLVFEYSESVKKREPSLQKIVILMAIIYLILTLSLHTVIFPAMGIQGLRLQNAYHFAVWLVSGIIWGFFMYMTLRWFQRRRWKKIKFAAPIPESIGHVIREILSSHEEKKITIGGKLVIGEKGICFVPHRFLQWQGKVLTADWTNTGRIYISRGRFSLRELFSGGIRDRLAIEIDGRDHFFVVNGIDDIVAELEAAREQNVRTG